MEVAALPDVVVVEVPVALAVQDQANEVRSLDTSSLTLVHVHNSKWIEIN